jgi:hypothetical protein
MIVENGRITALLDWEFAGWFPEHWEFVKFFETATKCRDWRDFADEIFVDTFPEELVTHQAILHWR